MSFIDPRAHRVFQLPEPVSRDTEIHEFGCQCGDCEPYAPSVPPRLDAIAIGKLAFAGVLVGNLIAFAIDPHGAAAALASCFGVR